MMQIENELDKAQEELAAANNQLEEKEKKVQEVSTAPILCIASVIYCSAKSGALSGVAQQQSLSCCGSRLSSGNTVWVRLSLKVLDACICSLYFSMLDFLLPVICPIR